MAFTGRGLTYEKMGDLARARADFEKALTITKFYDTNARPRRPHARGLPRSMPERRNSQLAPHRQPALRRNPRPVRLQSPPLSKAAASRS
jgi:hypothetical protein